MASFEIRPEWLKAPPTSWDLRLRQMSPVVDRTSHLRFRWRESVGQWEIYECTPAHLLDAERVEQLSVHWSDLPADTQHARQRFVTEYQHYMFRTHKLEARRFWVLQGSRGGTPAAFTERERKVLEAIGESGEVPPLGCLDPCSFDERAVLAIAQRDRLLKAGYDLDRLKRQSTVEALKSEDEDDDRVWRAAFLGWWRDEMQPMADFMKWYLSRTESDTTLRRATKDEANVVTRWRDHFIETGHVLIPEPVY